MSQRIAAAARNSGAVAVTGTLHSTDAAMEVVLRRVRVRRWSNGICHWPRADDFRRGAHVDCGLVWLILM